MSKDKVEKLEKQPTRGTKFYAAILHANGDFGVESFEALDQLVNRLKSLIDQDVSVFSFSGNMLPVSKPPFRHLLTPWGPKPLFDVQSEDLEIDTTGYLGIDPIHLTEPPVMKSPGKNKEFTDDAFFDDGDDNSVGVFDEVLPDPDS